MWKQTIIDHEKQRRLGIDLLQYCYCNLVHHTQQSEKFSEGGYAKMRLAFSAESLGVDTATINRAERKLIKKGLLEKGGRGKIRTTNLWEDAPKKIAKCNKKGISSSTEDCKTQASRLQDATKKIAKRNDEDCKMQASYYIEEENKNKREDKGEVSSARTREKSYLIDNVFLFKRVAEDMADLLKSNPDQWKFLCEQSGYTGTPEAICLEWAGKQDPADLQNWRDKIGRLIPFMKTAAKNGSLSSAALQQTSGELPKRFAEGRDLFSRRGLTQPTASEESIGEECIFDRIRARQSREGRKSAFSRI
ncbi:MAG: hypothetical protein KDC44_23800 [Phaeodactylibacter sp.]|nr:hypothetical protein [Phaeodactylibacter sp.]